MTVTGHSISSIPCEYGDARWKLEFRPLAPTAFEQYREYDSVNSVACQDETLCALAFWIVVVATTVFQTLIRKPVRRGSNTATT
jgi:hypothetical protein